MQNGIGQSNIKTLCPTNQSNTFYFFKLKSIPMKNSLLILVLIFPLLTHAQDSLSLDRIEKMIKYDDLLAFEKYLAEGNDLNDCYEINGSSYSMLILSIKFGRKKIFKYCIDEGADLNQICDDKTPLIYALKYERMGFFKKLLIRGANKEAKTEQGRTVIDYAKKYKREVYFDLLK